jgi:predicted MFS family arabinose efflux permease
MSAHELARATTRRLDRLVGGPARRKVVIAFAAVMALDSADKATVGVNATQLEQGLAIGRAQIGLLLAVTSFVGAGATIPAGVLVDRFDRTRILTWAVVLWAAAMVLSGLATGYPVLVLARVFLGCITAAASPAVASLIGDYFPPAERGRIYGFVLSGELIGAGFGFAIAGQVAIVSWRAPFLLLAIPSALVAWMIHRLPEPERGGESRLQPGAKRLPDKGEHRSPAQHDGPNRSPASRSQLPFHQAMRYVLSVRTNVVLIIASALGYFYFSAVEGFGVEFEQRHYGLSQSVSSVITLVLGIGALTGVLSGGRIADYLLHRNRNCARIEVPGVAVPLSGLLFIPALVTTSLATAVPLLIGAALFLGMANPPLDAARLDIMPPWLWGRAEAVRSVLRNCADGAAPLLFGLLSEDVFTGSKALEYTFLLLLVTLFAAGAVVLTLGRRGYPADRRAAEAARLPEGQPRSP